MAETRAAEAHRPSATCAFSINGRFYSQALTGVQRYGREITAAIDARLAGTEQRGLLVLPGNTRGVPGFRALDTLRLNGASGHLWEQALLPFRSDGPTLNLCNTGPLAAKDQTVCIHDANVFTDPGSYSPSFRLLYRTLLPRLAKRGFRITSVSHYSSDQLARFLPVASRDIAVIPNGHEHVFRWNEAASTLRDTLAGSRPFVLLLGSRARHKNVEFILAQAGALDALGLDLVVVGGSASIFSETESIESANIRRLGVVSDDDLAWLYRHAVCLAFPSRSEGFGIPIVEAMALGCPVIASNRASLPEVCGSAALMGDPDDAAAWQRHFKTLWQSAELRAELRDKGKEQARKFSWSDSARAYLALLGIAV